MIVKVANRQNRVPVVPRLVRWVARTILEATPYPRHSLSIVLTDNEGIHAMNLADRGMDRPTDVLSYPFYDELRRPGRLPGPLSKNYMGSELGEVVLSLEYVRDWCAERNRPFAPRIPRLLVHGIVHLMGYDHETPKETDAMLAVERRLLRKYREATKGVVIDVTDTTLADVKVKDIVKQETVRLQSLTEDSKETLS